MLVDRGYSTVWKLDNIERDALTHNIESLSAKLTHANYNDVKQYAPHNEQCINIREDDVCNITSHDFEKTSLNDLLHSKAATTCAKIMASNDYTSLLKYRNNAMDVDHWSRSHQSAMLEYSFDASDTTIIIKGKLLLEMLRGNISMALEWIPLCYGTGLSWRETNRHANTSDDVHGQSIHDVNKCPSDIICLGFVKDETVNVMFARDLVEMAGSYEVLVAVADKGYTNYARKEMHTQSHKIPVTSERVQMFLTSQLLTNAMNAAVSPRVTLLSDNEKCRIFKAFGNEGVQSTYPHIPENDVLAHYLDARPTDMMKIVQHYNKESSIYYRIVQKC